MELSTQVQIGVGEGLKHESSIHCEELVSILKSRLKHFVGRLGAAKTEELDRALAVALQLDQVLKASRHQACYALMYEDHANSGR
jgi:mRNA interferase MazF